MYRGFTLMELIVTLFISTVLMFVAVPNVNLFYQNYQLRGLATQLSRFFSTARTEALTRRQDLWVHFSIVGASSKNGWRLSLVEGNSALLHEEEILVTQGKDMQISSSWKQIKFDGRTGRLLENGHLLFSSVHENGISLKLIAHNVTGRVRICSIDKPFYGYLTC